MTRKYYQIRELEPFYGVDREHTGSQEKETVRQFLFTEEIPVYLSLRRGLGRWHMSCDAPADGYCIDSTWMRVLMPDREPPSFDLNGWFEVDKGSFWRLAHDDNYLITVFPTGSAREIGEFTLGDAPVYDFLDLWVATEHFERLRRTVPPAQAQPREKPLRTRERRTLLALIGVLCAENDIDLSHPSKAAGIIARIAAHTGVRISQRTIEDHLKGVDEALEARQVE